MRDLNMKVNGVYLREEGIRSIEKKEYGYLIDSIARGLMKAKTEEEINQVEKYIQFIDKRKKIFSNKLLTY